MSRTHLDSDQSSAHVDVHGTNIPRHHGPTRTKRRNGARAFWLHYAQMVLAMVVGMAVLGIPFRAILRAQGYSWDQAIARLTVVVCLVMTFNMAVAMVAWMRFRGHGWRACAEMTGAMYVATAIALGMWWVHLISADTTIGMMHVLMLPAMLGVMLYRTEEYSNHSMHQM